MRPLALAFLTGWCCLQATEAPRTLLIDGRGLVAAQERIGRGDPGLTGQLAALRADAERLLARDPVSVMDKAKVAASGDRHDYLSLAPYWWPDPSKPDGLPYLRKDGQRNPESRRGTDREALELTCTAVRTLGLAHWLTRDERYAGKAAVLTRVWFLDPATRMNPNLDYSQAIAGKNSGRGAGVLDARCLVDLCDGLALLAGSPAWNAADSAAMQAWLAEYYHWLITSANGRDEAAAANNHGSWYDVQAAGLALALGRTDDARRILSAVPTKRIARQIEPDGSQPLELARTRPFNYSAFNIEALTQAARLGRHVGLDLWSFRTPDGRSLRAAFLDLVIYLDPSIPWPRKDLDPPARGRLRPMLAEALGHVDDPRLNELWRKFGAKPAPGETWRLWLAPPP